MWSPSELLDGSEPHDMIYSRDTAVRCHADRRAMVERCTRGAAARWVLEGYYTGYQPEAEIEAYLMNIKG